MINAVVPLLLELINILLKICTYFLIDMIRYDSVTSANSRIQVSEFILAFFNSGFIILLINANLKGTGIPLTFFQGRYTDFSAGWYVAVAPLFITPMFIRYLLPVIGFSIKYFVKLAQ